MTLEGRCDSCGRVRSVRSLNLVCIEPPHTGPKWVLLCGPCVVDGCEDAA